MTSRHDMGHSVKMTVEIGAVALWYQFLLEYFLYIKVVENPHILPCLSLLDF